MASQRLAASRLRSGSFSLLQCWLFLLLSLFAYETPSSAAEPTTSTQPTQSAASSAQAKSPAKPTKPTKPGSTQTASAFSSGLDASLGSFTIQSFQADLFTGSAGADIPILVPPSVAGIAPKITLSYNSGVVDDIGADGDPDQADWTGLGWTLDTGGFVLRDTKGTTSTSDDTFKLIFGGHTYELVSIGSSNYRTKDETFLLINYNSGSDYWTVKTKAHRVIEWVDFSNKKGSKPDGNWL